jgi:hypothetical protein
MSRWNGCLVAGSADWVGEFLDPVAIDIGGYFRFAVLKVSDGRRERLLVRGRNQMDEMDMLRILSKEVRRIPADNMALVRFVCFGCVGGLPGSRSLCRKTRV